MACDYFCFFHSYGKKTERLSDEELGRLIRALLVYSETGARIELPDKEAMAFDFIADDIDIGHAKAESTSASRKKAVEVRENKRHQNNQMISNDSFDNKCLYTKTKTNTKTKESLTNVRDSKPTVEEVAEYCKERNNGIDPQHFVDYYQSQKWKKANGQPLTDWKAAVRYWESRERASSDRYGSGNFKQKIVRMDDLDNLIGGKTWKKE